VARRALVSAAVFAGVWLGGLAAGLGYELKLYADRLPALDLSAAAERSVVAVDHAGRLLRPFTTPRGIWRLPVTASDVDPRYLAMLYAYEDRRFHDHAGVDPLALMRAAGQLAWNGRIVSGGSTLTMQVARLVEPRAERSFGTKLRQALRAIELERTRSKAAILDLYLALAPFGGNIEGVRAASLAYFGKEPRRLSLAEAALLVALPQAPGLRRPDRFPEAARAARDRVLDRAAQTGVIDRAEAEAAKAEPAPTARLPFPMRAAHAAEAARREAPDRPVLRLTIDANWQDALQRLATERAERAGPRHSVAIVVVENATGAVRAAVGGAGYLSRDRAGAMDLTLAERSPGSALKPLIYALAFENGIAHPETLVEDRPSRFGLYAPQNFDEDFHGVVTARTALQQSLNVPAVEMLSLYGPNRFLGKLKAVGARYRLPPGDPPGLAIALGGIGLSPRELARLYAALARGGVALPLTVDADRLAGPIEGRRLTDPVASWYVADVLRGAPPPEANLQGRLSFKTGTSYGYRDAWSAGYDRNHTVVVWVGRPDGAPSPGLVGRLVAAPILFDAFKRIGLDDRPFDRPDGAIVAASTGALPPPLRHLRRDAPKTVAATAVAALSIAYPPDGARLDLGWAAGRPEALSLKAAGGRPPFTWLLDGRPLARPTMRRAATAEASGPGFSRISVIDADGATASVSVRLE
jgi:penicillin-binding protein 1C